MQIHHPGDAAMIGASWPSRWRRASSLAACSGSASTGAEQRGGGRARPPAPSTAPARLPARAAGAPSSRGRSRFLHKYSDPRYAPYFEAVVAAYMAAHPNVKINVQAESDQGVKDKLRVLAASKPLPDIYFSWAGDFTKKFVGGGLAKDLTGDVTRRLEGQLRPGRARRLHVRRQALRRADHARREVHGLQQEALRRQRRRGPDDARGAARGLRHVQGQGHRSRSPSATSTAGRPSTT